jgi:4-hydroxybenzoate polyprenyltransferase
VPPLAWVLLLGNLFWVIAYDTAGYAMVDRDDAMCAWHENLSHHAGAL